MGYLANVNVIRDKLYDLIEVAGIKNISGFGVTMYKRALPDNIDKNSCPFISVFKDNCAGNSIGTDQADVELPQRVNLIIDICDGSAVDVNQAEVLTDDLSEQVIAALETNVALDGTVKGMEIPKIEFDQDRNSGVFFSVVRFFLELQGTNLI